MIENHTFTTPKAQAKITRILTALEQQPMTRDELQCLLGIAKPTMRRYIAHLTSAPRLIHIRRWKRTTGMPAPVYAIGSRKDAAPPRIATRTERNQLEWQRIKADPDRHARVKAAARVHGRIQRVRQTPQPWFAALLNTRTTQQRTAP